MIPLVRLNFDISTEEALRDVLCSGRLVQGPWVERLENEIASLCQRKHAVAISNGTAALQLALAASNVGPGDEVICPDLSWPSPAHAIVLAGAKPVLIDVDPYEWNSPPELYKKAHSSKTKAAIVIDQFGNPARFAEIKEALPGVVLIEDAACGIGSRRHTHPCGSFGTIACLSFHPRKIITTGEGGMCLTDDDALAQRLRVLRNHGQLTAGEFLEAAGNYRLSEIAAAVGVTQLASLSFIVKDRRRLAITYREALPMFQWQREAPGGTSNMQTLGALLPESTPNDTRKQFIARARELGVELGILSYAIHTLNSVPPNSAHDTLVHSSSIVSRGLSIPLYAGMTEEEQNEVISVLKTVWSEVIG